MAIDDRIKALTRQLYPTGRVWRINPNGIKEKLINGTLASETRAYNDAVSILDSALPDNANFTADDASAWEARLGLPDGTGTPLDQRMDAIKVQLNWPGTNPAKGSADYIQATLQAAGFNTCVLENLFYTPAGSWTNSSLPAVNNVIAQALLFANNKFIVATEVAGNIYTSSDGISWGSLIATVGAQVETISFGAGLYVTGNTNGQMYSSPDLITWTLRATLTNVAVHRIIFAGGQFIGVSRDSTHNLIATSPDGITWTARTTPMASDWRSVAYNGSLYVAVSFGGKVMTSSDGITWTLGSCPASQWTGVAFGNGIFVATGTGAAMTSPDGTTWTARTAASGAAYYSLVYGSNLFVAVALGTDTMTSPDGITWTLSAATQNSLWTALAFGNNTFVGAGYNNSTHLMVAMYSTSGGYYHKTYSQFAGTDFVRYKSTLQYGQQNYGMLSKKGVIVANSVDPSVDDSFDIGDGSDTIFIGGCPPGTFINIPKSQETAFRQLILKIKPVNITVLLLVNFV